MLCLKCGQEYEGASCPRCDGPVVLVNNSDYLARKKAYEEKQAKLKESASSDKKVQSGTVSKKQGSETKKPGSNNKKNNKDNKKDNESEDRRVRAKQKRRRQIRIRLAIIGVVLGIVLVVSGIGIYKLATRKDHVIYMSYNGKIYNVSSIESEFVCNEKDAVFTVDMEAFYQPDWPEGMNKDNIIQTVASDKGKYFAAVTYNEAGNDYQLWVWNDSYSITSERDLNHMELLYISDEGNIVYTSARIINEEGSIENHQLIVGKAEVSKDKKMSLTTNIIENDLQKVCVYAKQSKIITLSGENTLNVYDYKKGEKKIIDEEIDGFLTMDEQIGYVSNAGYVNNKSIADSFYYISSDKYYRCNLSDYSSVYVTATNGSNVSFYEDEKNRKIYMISSGVLTCLTIDKEGKVEEGKIADLGTQLNVCYLYNTGTMLLVDNSNQLLEIHNGEINVLEKSITDGTLGIINNSSNYICYLKDGRLYYKKSIGSEPVQIMSNQSFTSTGGMSLYKKRLYYYDSKNILHSCSLKGKDENSIGNVDRFWIGVE